MGGEVTLNNGLGLVYSDGCELDKLGSAVAQAENALHAARKQLRKAQLNVVQCEAELKAARDEFNDTAHRVVEIKTWASLLEVRQSAHTLWHKLVGIIKQLPPEEAEQFDELFEATGSFNPDIFSLWSVPQELLDDLYQEHKRLQGSYGGPGFEQGEDEWGRFFFLKGILGADKLR
jgi:chromosome segregation ATPase